jgi:formylglycine-generating enzyme required for sulfatase activity
LLLVASAWAQDPQKQLKSTGSCGRCHVASVLEWSVSKHQHSGTGCTACHGESKGHVIDERNNVKPDRIPRGAAIAGLCATCHVDGCEKTPETADCQTCHHAHALLNPASGKELQDQRLNMLTARWDGWANTLREAERLYRQGSWPAAREAFRRAATARPDDPRAPARIAACDRRLSPALPGFEILGPEFDLETGLATRVRVAGTGIEMIFVPGGEADLGSDTLKNAFPVHTVRVEPFYFAKYELTQGQWRQLTGATATGAPGDRRPGTNLSWEDCLALIEQLNRATAGAGFRLPSEIEWEYAARAGRPFEPAAIARLAWFRDGAEPAGPRDVGTRLPNAWELYDLLGNVWEWCADAAEPPGHRILRGGGYADSARYIDPAMRHSERAERRCPWNGLRLARTVPK